MSSILSTGINTLENTQRARPLLRAGPQGKPPLQNQLRAQRECGEHSEVRGDGARPRPEDLAGRPCPSPRPPRAGHRQSQGAQDTGRARAGHPQGQAAFWRPDRWTQGHPGACPLPPGPHHTARSPPPRSRPLGQGHGQRSGQPQPFLQSPPPGRTHTSRALSGEQETHLTVVRGTHGTHVSSHCHCVNSYSPRESHFCAIKRNSACSLKRNAVDQAKPMQPRTQSRRVA